MRLRHSLLLLAACFVAGSFCSEVSRMLDDTLMDMFGFHGSPSTPLAGSYGNTGSRYSGLNRVISPFGGTEFGTGSLIDRICIPGENAVPCAASSDEYMSNQDTNKFYSLVTQMTTCYRHGCCWDAQYNFCYKRTHHILKLRDSCEPGFVNPPKCEEINECESDPCQNGGTCNDLINAFSCDCPSGFLGEFCEVTLTMGTTPMTYELARAFCDGTGTELVQFETQDDYDRTVEFAATYFTSQFAAGWGTLKFWTDMYRENDDEVFIFGGGGQTGYTKWKPNEFPAPENAWNIGVWVDENMVDDGLEVGNFVREFYPMCRSPPRTPATDFCLDGVCYMMGDTPVDFETAVSYCRGLGASLVEIHDEDEYNDVSHFVRHSLRLLEGVATLAVDEKIWTKMHMDNQVAYLSSGYPAYDKWATGQEPLATDDSSQIRMRVVDAHQTNDGYYLASKSSSNFPVCRLPYYPHAGGATQALDTEYCDAGVCYSMAPVYMTHADAITHCADKGLQLVEILTEEKFLTTLHYARAHGRQFFNTGWSTDRFWTNMYALNAASVVVNDVDETPAYVEWRGSYVIPGWANRYISMKFAIDALHDEHGMQHDKEDKELLAMCETIPE